MKKSLFLSGSFLLFVTNSVERTGKVLAVCLLVLFHILSSGDITAQINVTATAGNMGPVAYTTLKGAFDAINAGTHQGAITIDVNGDTNEGTATATLNASGSGMASYTSILMTPSGGAIRTISGATTAGNPLLDLNGADNVSIDGLNSGGNALTISNTTASSTSGTSTIRFIGGATGNTITNCSIQGSGSMAVATNGAVIFFSTDGVTANGNDNNTISNCNIGPVGANLPTKGILGNGSTTTTAIGNSGIIINNNNIFDYFGAAVTSSGVAINGGCNTWSITNNRFYQTAARTWTTGAVHRAIDLNSSTATSGVQGMTVTGNIIGFASNTQTGTYTLTGSTGKFQGIAFNGISTGTISNINNNTIAGVSLTGVTSSGTGSTASPFSAILINNGLVNTNSNTIGSQSSTGSLTFSTTTTTTSDFYGIYNFSVDDWTANSNNIGGISITNLGASGTMTFYGMRANTSGTKNFSAASNNVGGTVANSIQLTSTGASSQVIGIIATLAIATHTSNTVRNLTNNNGTGTTTSASVIGMSYNTTTPNQIVSQNTIHTLTASSTTLASVVTGIQFTGGTANIVERNLIYNLLAPTTSASAEVNGIRVAGGTTTYRNNMIILGAGMTNAIGAAATNSSVAGIVGFNEALGTNNVWHNSIYIGGSPTSGSGSSYAFNGVQTTNTRSFRDNIFVNARSNAGATGKNYAIKINGTTPNPTGLTINNNVYYATGSGAVFGFFNSLDVANLAAWKVAVGQDAASFESNPQYLDPTNANPDLHLNPSISTVAEANGIDLGVTDDYDGQTRASLTPVDIGADAGNYMGIDLAAPVITYTLLTNTSCVTNPVFAATITDNSGVNTNPGTKPRVWYRKKTNLNVLPATNDNTTNGWKYMEASNAASPFNFTIDYALVFGGVTPGDTMQYFVVAQDLAATPNLGINAGVFNAQPPTVALNAGAFPVTNPNSYKLVPTLGTALTIGAAGTYLTLSGTGGLFAALNGSALTGNTVVTILDASIPETGTVALNPLFFACGGGPYTLTIKPAPGVTTVLSGSAATALIDLNGVDNIVIDGSNNGTTTKDMTIRNTNSSGAAVRLINDATGNLVKNCILESGNTSTTSGTVFFSTSTGTLGNSMNTINNCDIRDRSDVSGVPANAVYSSGSAGAPNGSNTISGCRIFNFTASGVLISSTGAGNGWTINPTSFYQTADRTTALTVISILGGNGHSLLNNSIGGAAADRSGAPMKTTAAFTAISLAVGTTTATSIQGNTISNLNISGGSTQTFRGITITSGNVNVGTITGNTLGGGAAAFDTIRTNYDSDLIENSGTGTVAISNNLLGNISYYNAGNDRLFGIRGMAGTITISNNIVRDLKSNGSGTGFSFFPGGIWLATTVAGAIVENNQVFNITQLNTGTSAYTIAGIYVTGVSSTGTATEIRKNKIYNLNALGTGTGTSSPRLWGIHVAGGSATYSNNMIAIAGGANQTRVNGIEDLGTGTNFYYFNSVSISGTTTAGTNNMYAFNRSGTSTVTIKNNVFSNTRTGGTGFHVALANTNAAATGWAATASNNNDLYNNTPTHLCQWLGTAAANNRDLPGWQAAQGAGTPGSGGDANSWNIAPVFVSATDLHIPAGTNTPLESGGTNVGITTDIDNDTRPGPTGSVNGGATAPDIGVDEFDGTPASPMMYVSSTTTQNNIANVSTNTINQEVIGIQVVTSGILSPLSVTSISAHTNGTTNVADITNAKVWFTGSSPSFATTTQFGSTIAFPSGAMNFMGSATMATGTNYFWVTYDIPCAGTPGNVIDAECNTIVISGSQTPTVQAPTGSRAIITGPLAGTYTVGTGGNYTSLESAVSDVNTKGLNGNTTLSLLNSLTLSGPLTINQWIECGAGGYTLTISPATGTAVTVTGNSGGTASALIKLNGADRVTIDGLNTGGASLSIENTSITGGTAVIWLSSLAANQGATNNNIRNCTLKAGIAQNASTTTTYGVVLAGSTLNSSITSLAAGNDNDNNQITDNTILKCRYGIVCFGGSTTNPNLGTVIQNNTIGPISFNADLIGKGGIVAREENGIQILGNRIQFIGGDYASQPTGGDRAGITLGTDASWTPTTAFVKNAVIANNKIHDIIEERTFSAVGIILGGVDGTNSTSNYVVNNMLYNIRANGTSSDQAVAIGLSAGKDDAVVFNSIYLTGDTDPNASATTPTVSNFGVSISSTSVVNPTFKDNIIFNDLSSSSATTLKNANINIPASFVWGTGSSDVNDLYRNSSNTQTNTGCVGGSGGTFYATLADWQTASSQDAMSFNILPVFVSPTNLHLDPGNDALDSLGMPIAGVSTDIDGDNRNGTHPDPGADEYTPVSCVTAEGGMASGSTSFCVSGTPTITATGYSVGIGSTYQWMSSAVITNYPNAGTPVPGQTNPASLVTGVVSQTTYYWLMVTCGTNSSTDSSNLVTVTINALPTASITPSGTVNLCPPTTSQLLTAMTNAAMPGYVWKKNGVTIVGATSATYSATSSGSYTVVITDGVTTCANTSVATVVNFNPAPSAVTITPSSVSMCANDNPVLLTANGGTVGSTVAPVANSGTVALDGNPYRTFWDGERLQFIYFASELTAAGLTANSQITALAFDVAIVGDPILSFTIKMGHTALSAFANTTFVAGNTTVFTSAGTFTPVSGVNTHTFNTPFTWNGTDNIIIETCFASNLSSTSSQVKAVPSIANTVNTLGSDTGGCGSATGTLSGVRPYILITYAVSSSKVWTPNGMGSGLYTDMNGMTPYTGTPASSIYAKPASTTTYTVTATSDAGCTSTGSVTVTVNPQPTITLGSNPSVCQGITSANLSYSATTGSPNQYSIDYDVTAQGQGFVDVTNEPLSASPIVLVVPGAAALGTYNATLTVRNSSTTCMSNTYPITVTVTTPPNAGTVTGTTPLCIGVMATYTSNGDMGGTWTSTNTSVATVNPTTGVVTAVAAGSTNITYTVDGGGSCLPTSSFQALTVDPALVLNTNDSGAGSLRDIIACVGDGATITIDASLTGQTITLTTGEININKNLTINGPGMLNLTISGNDASRIFHLQPAKTLMLSGMALTHGAAVTNGGAIWVEGMLNLQNIILQLNTENGTPKALTVSPGASITVTNTVNMNN